MQCQSNTKTCKLMKSKSLLAVSAILVLLMVSQAASADNTSGYNVKAGDWMAYSVNTVWQSNQTGVFAPFALLSLQNIQSINISVLAVSQEGVNCSVQYVYKDGSSQTVNSTTVAAEQFRFIVPANQSIAWSITLPDKAKNVTYDLATRTYGTTQRLVNRVQLTQTIGFFENVSTLACWDNQTGVATEQTLSYSSNQENSTTVWSTEIKINSTSLFSIGQVSPGFKLNLSPTQIAIIAGVLVAVIVVSSVGVWLYRRRHKKDAPKTPFEGEISDEQYRKTRQTYPTSEPQYYQHPYYRKPYGRSPYMPPPTKPTSYYASQAYHQKPPAPNYTRPGATTRICPNCKQIVAATNPFCPNCNKKLR
jgi:hypothetical protein